MARIFGHRGVLAKTFLVFIVETWYHLFGLRCWRHSSDSRIATTIFSTAQRGLYKIAMTTLVSQFIFYLFSLYDISKPRLRRELLIDLFQAVGAVIFVFGLIFTFRPTLLLGYL
jgi:hypothetical protein